MDINRKGGEKKRRSGSPGRCFSCRQVPDRAFQCRKKQANGEMRCGDAGRSTGEADADQPNVERTSVQ